jgi:hypothetical protein
MLVLIIVAAGVLGFLVLWFTMLRHERTALHRARRSSSLRPELIGDSATALFTGTAGGRAGGSMAGNVASPAVTKYEPVHDADGADHTPDDLANEAAAPGVDTDAVEPESESGPESAPESDLAAEPPMTAKPPPASRTPRARRRPKKRRRK